MQLVIHGSVGLAGMWLLSDLDDPNFKKCRPRHREFMTAKAKLLDVVPFRSTPELLNLVVFTYRLEYVRECVLFPYLNDNGFGSSACVPLSDSDHPQQLQKNPTSHLQPQEERFHQLALRPAAVAGPSGLQASEGNLQDCSDLLCTSFPNRCRKSTSILPNGIPLRYSSET